MMGNDFYGLNKINFWRTTNQTEVDFVIQNEEGLEAVEVKWASNKIPKSFETLKAHLYRH